MSSQDQELTVLIIEDNPGDFALVEEFLFEQIALLTVHQAKNYKEARDLINSFPGKFDVILLDLSLPDKTGLPLIKEIVEISSDAPVIVLTGYADFEFGVKSLSLGISDYILKEELTPLSLYKSVIYSLERKKAISTLATSEKKYGELFHLSPLPMFVYDIDSMFFLDANEAFFKHYGYNQKELLAMTLTQIMPEHEPFDPEIIAMYNNHKKRDCNFGVFSHVKKDTQVIHVDIQSNFIDYKGKNAKVIIATDISERLNYISAIEKQNKKLREISWIQSHIVRAPLARIMGLIQVFTDLNCDSDERAQMLDYLSISANELDEVIKTITDKTKVEDDKQSGNYYIAELQKAASA